MLKSDINLRVRELDTLITLKSSSNGLKASRNLPMMSSVILNNNSSTNPAESLWNNNNCGANLDPFLNSMLNKFQHNLELSLMDTLKSGSNSSNNNDKKVNHNVQDVSLKISEQMSQFKKELRIYEQQKCKEFQLRMEQALAENKKLSNQIVKLRERWDSLVESAKQKRNRQR
ncbi:hypothetical protein Kpol_1019p14 [Vanderwaltozyma polyspora DSM 70294]|uniref:Uncharacterized protein n=1 Tax=Vanderwaltozyma polyspora (strain ATCC 22028 / DSM 70294 / BCRC 21397 / CBS 2163 / NBRC 10782 / NRRL Y-8283 / UCD 57-17) TaxID=436907 RepID=A7TPA7_VANPO|nr:uncharacterized protein Kpol_1019p14 [Vanderwaltozyma polyspora DSM 70294]EDO15894.1 hypothetical protein Kpol_1019p14 [Vanderwaltozyma polyspora DSM 70294]